MENKTVVGPSSPSSSTVSTNYTDTTDQSQNSNDNNSSNTSTISRATKNWRKIKEISEKEDKRPPWRMVSLSTLPKADKNAILRAKLLDASRRMRAGKIPVGVQTDIIPAKLFKEVNIEIQSDLIEMRDAENLTDGTITLKPDGPVILTYSVTQMTDEKQTKNVQTQTASPATSHRFFEEYFNEKIADSTNQNFKNMNFTRNEIKLLNQIKEIRLLDNEIKNNKNTANHIDNKSEKSSSDDDHLSIDSLLSEENECRRDQDRNPMKKKSVKKYQSTTESLWSFDYDEEQQHYNIQSSSSTSSNRGAVINKFYNFSNKNDSLSLKKTRNMTLLPNSERKSLLLKQKSSNSWSNDQCSAICDLLNATTSLLDIFKQLSIVLGPDIQLNDIPNKYDDEVKINFLSDYWYPILQDSARILDKKIAALKPIERKLVTPINITFFDDEVV